MSGRKPTAPLDHLETVAAVSAALSALGLQPVLVGGMALVMLGSRRVTRDFDFVISHPRESLPNLLDVFYELDLELVSRLNETGDVATTLDNRRVAAVRLRIDNPASAYFYNRRTGLRIDLLFDYPVAAALLAERGVPTTVRSTVICVASEKDLLHLKQIARANRSSAGDAEDIAFLEARQTQRDPPDD